MRRWPWITFVFAAVAVLSPLGREVIRSAFLSGEQLSRSIALPVLLIGVVAVVAFGAIEWTLKWALRRRRSKPGP